DLFPMGALLRRRARRARRPVESNPGHDLGMDEMLRLPPNLPDALVRTPPDLFQMAHEDTPDLLGARRCRQATRTGLGSYIGKLAIDVELKLTVRGIADAHRAGIFIAGQMRQLQL